jgi:hypothetical protein
MVPPKTAGENFKKHFTADEANRMLPLVRPIVADVVRQWELVHDLEQRLGAVTGRGPQRSGAAVGLDAYDEELAQTHAELEEEQHKLRSYVQELHDLGVQLKGFDGLCDFPSVRDGREIFLCWRLGEPEVAFWHDLKTGFAGRQPLYPAPAAAGGKSGR